MKRSFSLLLVLCMVLALLPVSCLAAGSCGADLTWKIEGDTLTISGSGPMTNFSWNSNRAPWYSQRSLIHAVVLENGVESIGDYAFYSCSALRTITFPENEISIGRNAFESCTSLQTVHIPKNVTSVARGAFYKCSGLQSVELEPGIGSIAEHVFRDCTALKSIAIPEGITTIVYFTFWGCTALESVTLPSTLTTIEQGAFYGCRSLTQIMFPPNLSFIGENAFYGCSTMTDASLSNPDVTIGENAFYGCSNLTSVPISSDRTEIKDNEFSGWKELSSVSIPDGVTSIGSSAFQNCESLTNVQMPKTVETIGTQAFSACSGLQCITIPVSLKRIGEGAFAGCLALTDVFYTGTQEQWEQIEIGPRNEPLLNATIHFNCVAELQGPDFTENVSKWLYSGQIADMWKYLCASPNFPASAFIAANDGTFGRTTTEFLSDAIYRGLDGWKDLLSSATSVEQAEKILAGFMVQQEGDVRALTEAKASKELAEFFVQLLEVYMHANARQLWLNNADIQKLKEVLTAERVSELLQQGRFGVLTNFLVTKCGYAGDSNEVKAVQKFTSSDQMSKALSDGIDFLDAGLKSVEVTYETFQKIYQLDCILQADEMFIDMLRYLQTNCVYGPVQTAAGNLLEMIEGNVREQISYVQSSIRKAAAGTVIDFALDKASECSLIAWGIRMGYTWGVDIANTAFHTADSQEAYSEMRCLAYIGQALSGWALQNFNACSSALHGSSDPEAVKDAARTFYYSLDLLWSVRHTGEEVFRQFWRNNRVKQGGWYDRSLEETFRLDRYKKIYFGSATMQNFVQTLVACPVDVTVVDADGSTIVTIPDGQETENTVGDVHYTVIKHPFEADYCKIIQLPVDSGYRIVCSGTDLGVVNCTVSEMNADGTVVRSVLAGVPVEKDTQIEIVTPCVAEAAYTTTEPGGEAKQGTFTPAETEAYVAPTAIRLGQTAYTMKPGERLRVDAIVEPQNANLPYLLWESSDPAVAEVNGDGVVTAKADGTAVLTARTEDGAVSVTCTVTVRTSKPIDPPAPKNPFADVPASEYYYDPVLWAVNHDPQITNGTSDTTFSPDATCTRGQVVTFIWRAMGCPEPTSTANPFRDVAPSDYFYKAVLWANENGITNGTTPTTFGSNDPCTRAHVVTFLWRAEHQPAAGGANPFVDVPAGQYFTTPVLWAVSKNITNGTSANTFSPDNPCTRGQIVTFLYRDMK